MSAVLTSSAVDPSVVQADIARLEPQVITWRRHLHKHPEQAFNEHETSAWIASRLAEISSIEVSRPTETSVLGILRGARAGKVIAVRADIDALPIQEENDCEYKSCVDGSMHACGHDGHTAILLGLANILASHRQSFDGEVRLIFQHAEELSPGGAEELVKRGVMDGVHEIIGLHLWAPLPFGKIGLLAGPSMAAPDTFECQIIGKGGHAAQPHETVDPITVGAQVITALQHIASRVVDPLDPVVLSVTQFIAGTTFNVTPNTAYLAGTVRTFDAGLRSRIPAVMERIIRGITEAHGASYEFTYERGYRPVVNDTSLTERLRRIASDTFGDEILADIRPSMGGEDFSAYQQRAPGVFAFVGARNEERGITFPHHHPRFDIDERALALGLHYLTAATLELLR